MIIKSYKDNFIEVLITQNEDNTCNVIKLINNKESEFQSKLDIESALTVFSIWMNEEPLDFIEDDCND